jgi:TolB-like protein/DNA-binding winged helix-turn-helix (wHTH) protein
MHAARGETPQATSSEPLRFRFADLVLDVGRRRLQRGTTTLPLGKLTYRLLVALVRAAPNVVTQDELIQHVWGGRNTTPETVTQRVKLLRAALGDDAEQPRYVGLVRNHGYRLLPRVETLPAEGASGTAVSTGARPARRAGLAAAALAGAAFAALGGVAAVWLAEDDAQAAPLSLAVLPLVDLSVGGDHEYFADGMTEALIANLAKLTGFRVISRTSVMRYKDGAKSVPEIARELGVAAVLEGSAQLDGDRVRITAQLIDARTDRHLWAETYDRDLQDVLSLQSEIARTIAERVEVTVTPEEAARLAATRQVDPETYRAYLRGMHRLNQATPEDVAAGLAFLHEAVDRDPGDALAYAGLAMGYATLGHGPAPQADAWPLARAAAQRAIGLDPNLAEAHAALADVKLYMEWDWEGAEQAFLRANELAPSLAMNHYHYAWYLALFDRWDEAVAAHKRAAELDPLTPLHILWLGGLYLYDHLGRHAEALVEAERALKLAPDHPVALMILGRAHSAAGRHTEAITVHRRMVDLNPDLLWQLGLTYAMAGRHDDTRAVLAELAQQPTTSWTAYGRAMLHAQLGEVGAAFEWLAYEPPHAWVPWIRTDPWLRPPLEHDPRFSELLARLRLPP